MSDRGFYPMMSMAPVLIRSLAVAARLPVLPAHQPWSAVCEKGIEYYEARYRDQQIRSLAKRRKNLACNYYSGDRVNELSKVSGKLGRLNDGVKVYASRDARLIGWVRIVRLLHPQHPPLNPLTDATGA